MTSHLLVLGIDPGFSGALAWVRAFPAPAPPVLLAVADMPTFAVTHGRTKSLRSSLNLAALADLLDGPLFGTPDLVVIEEVHALPKQGLTSTFRFGFGAGALAGAVAARKLPLSYLTPQQWKPQAGLRGGAVKGESRQRATQLFPTHAAQFARVKDDGRADAALIAWVGARRLATAAAG